MFFRKRIKELERELKMECEFILVTLTTEILELKETINKQNNQFIEFKFKTENPPKFKILEDVGEFKVVGTYIGMNHLCGEIENCYKLIHQCKGTEHRMTETEIVNYFENKAKL